MELARESLVVQLSVFLCFTPLFTQRLTFLVMFETGFIVLAALLDFVVAIVITAGLDKTCDSFGTTQNT